VVVELDAEVVGGALKLEAAALFGTMTSTRLSPWFGSIPRSSPFAAATPATASETTTKASNARQTFRLLIVHLPPSPFVPGPR
jgi:hypothetical protein